VNEKTPSSAPPRRRGLLIVDHGTRNEAANARFAALAQRIADARSDWLVEHAHMEIAQPGFEAGISLLVERGALEILVHLHFLGAGYHVRESIPELVESVRAKHPEIHIETTAPLGDDPRIVEIVLGRMDERADQERQSSKA